MPTATAGSRRRAAPRNRDPRYWGLQPGSPFSRPVKYKQTKPYDRRRISLSAKPDFPAVGVVAHLVLASWLRRCAPVFEVTVVAVLLHRVEHVLSGHPVRYVFSSAIRPGLMRVAAQQCNQVRVYKQFFAAKIQLSQNFQ